MTAAEQASLERLAARVDEGFAEMRSLMESRRVEEVRVQEALRTDALQVAEALRTEQRALAGDLVLQIKKVDDRVDTYDRTRTIAEAFFIFGRWLLGTIVALAGLYIAYRSTTG